MRMIVIVLTFLTACGAMPHMLGPAPTLSDPAVAKLSAGDDGSCTVWKTTHGLAITAGHCCDVGMLYSAEGPHAVPGATFEVLFDDDEHDVCVLRGKLSGDVIFLANQDPQIGERIWTAGYPRGKFLISDGFWSGRDEENEGICSSVVGFGASGSPILNLRGESVGVLIKRFGDMDNLGFVAPIEWVKRAVIAAKLK